MRRILLTAVLSLVACKKPDAAPPAPPPAPVKPAEPPPAPKVELPEAPALPAMPLGLAAVASPAENPTTAERAELGWFLFFDKRASKDGSMACENCHHIDKAYTSGEGVDAKVGGGLNKRNAPSMLNLGTHPSFYWDGRMPTLEAVSNAAWKGQLGADPAEVVKRLNEIPQYKARFERAFGEPATPENVPRAYAAFFRALNNGNSPWDKALAGDKAALSKDAQAGEKLFTAKGCIACHTPPLFTNLDFENIGIGTDEGRKDATKADADVGRFMTPSLRNVALTAPYFHDGSVKTLDEAIEFMAKGGNKNPNLSAKLKPQKVSKKEIAQIKAFLESLTGESTYATAPTLP